VLVNYLVVESSLAIRESLCYVLLSFGIKGIPVENRQAALQVLDGGEPVEGVIVDIDNKDADGIQLVTELREGEKTRRLPVIAHTIQTSREAVMRMVDLGVAGCLLKPFTAEAARSKLAAVFSKLATHNSQRKHIRVKPDPQELVRVSFRVPPSSQLVSGRVVDISLGGMAAELFNLPPSLSLTPGTTLTGMEIFLSGKEIAPSSSVVLLKLNVLAVRFEILAPSDKKALERYIFKSISS
jgi:DNA-binding response OmpR family regulator